MKPYEFPKLVIEEHEGFHIVRDDLLEGGSKRRFVDRMIEKKLLKVLKNLFMVVVLQMVMLNCL